MKKQKAPVTFEEEIRRFSPRPKELGTVVDGKIMARGLQVLRRMERHDAETMKLNPRLVQKSLAPLVRSVLKTSPKPFAPPAEKKTLAKLAAEQAEFKQRKAAMEAERTVLRAIAKKQEQQRQAEIAKQRQEKQEVRKELGLTKRVEGHGGLVSSPISLPGPYAMSGAHIAHGAVSVLAAYRMFGTDKPAISGTDCLSPCHAIRGTNTRYKHRVVDHTNLSDNVIVRTTWETKPCPSLLPMATPPPLPRRSVRRERRLRERGGV
eukprot:2748002-Rhodomonas_salina.4